MKFPAGTKFIIYAPVVKGRKGRHEDTLADIRRAGFVRVRVDDATYPIEEVPALDKKKNHSIDVVIDRLVIPGESEELKVKSEKLRVMSEDGKTLNSQLSTTNSQFVTRLTDSVELGLKTGHGLISVDRLGTGETTYSEKNACPDCELSFDELKPRSFSFNSPFGACPTCGGLGSIYFFDEDLVVPDKTLPLRECIHPWRRAGHMAIMYYNGYERKSFF